MFCVPYAYKNLDPELIQFCVVAVRLVQNCWLPLLFIAKAMSDCADFCDNFAKPVKFLFADIKPGVVGKRTNLLKLLIAEQGPFDLYVERDALPQRKNKVGYGMIFREQSLKIKDRHGIALECHGDEVIPEGSGEARRLLAAGRRPQEFITGLNPFWP